MLKMHLYSLLVFVLLFAFSNSATITISGFVYPFHVHSSFLALFISFNIILIIFFDESKAFMTSTTMVLKMLVRLV